MMFWCYQCQLNTPGSQYARVCDQCGSSAIEMIQQGVSNPSNFRPYQIGGQQIPQQSHSQSASEEIQTIEIPIRFELETIFIRSLDDPSFVTVIRRLVPVIGNVVQKKTVTEEQFQKLQKSDFVEECAICQQSGKNGVKLPCSHNFHQKCIKPWFDSANTCPCCRKQVNP